MKRTTAGLCALLGAALMAGAASAQTDGVTALRGAGGEAVADDVAVLRGAPAPSRPAAEHEKRTTVVLPFIAAGEKLWLREARTGRLVACRVRGSGQVGQSVIRCTRR